MEKSAEFMRLLRPTASGLRTIAQPLGHAFAEGAVNLSAATALNTELANAAKAFQAFAQNPVVTLGLEDLTQTTTLGNPLVAGLAPEQVTCNYLTLAFRNFASTALREHRRRHARSRAAGALPGRGQRRGLPLLGAGQRPLDRSGSRAREGKLGPLINDNHLHYNPYPNVAGPGQPQECEAGNETYAVGQTVIGHAPGNAGTTPEATTRELNLYGQPYPSSTLKSLGLESAQEKAAKEKKQKEKAKKEQEEEEEGEGQVSRLRLRPRRRRDELSVVEMQRYNPLRVGAVFLVIILIAVFFAFTKHIPFKHGYRLKAVFATAVDIHPASPVRIAGVNVGTVKSIRREGAHRPGEHGNRIERPADPRRRHAEDPPAAVPGRQLLRRTAAGQPLGADALLGRDAPDHADLRPGPARPGARRAEYGHARQPAELPAGLWRRADARADGRRKRRTGPRRVRPERRAGAQQDIPPRALGRCAARRSTPRR